MSYPQYPNPYWSYPLYNQPIESEWIRAATCISQAAVQLLSDMRMLWEQHITWTRLAIQSLVFNTPDQQYTIARLLRSGPDMGNVLIPYYGEEIGKAYGNLIKEHLVIAADLVKAAIKGDQQAVASIERKWYANADQIVDLLGRINPYFPKEAFRKMFYKHLTLVKSEATTLISKDYKANIEIFDQMEQDALMIADTITASIIKQFPQMFR